MVGGGGADGTVVRGVVDGDDIDVIVSTTGGQQHDAAPPHHVGDDDDDDGDDEDDVIVMPQPQRPIVRSKQPALSTPKRLSALPKRSPLPAAKAKAAAGQRPTEVVAVGKTLLSQAATTKAVMATGRWLRQAPLHRLNRVVPQLPLAKQRGGRRRTLADASSTMLGKATTPTLLRSRSPSARRPAVKPKAAARTGRQRQMQRSPVGGDGGRQGTANGGGSSRGWTPQDTAHPRNNDRGTTANGGGSS